MVSKRIISLDVGERRIGVASGWTDVKIASPLTTLTQSDHTMTDIDTMLSDQQAAAIVVGLPRNLSGDDTAQTTYVRQFADTLRAQTKLAVYFQDEALSSRRAESELATRRAAHDKGAVDALAATYILEDFFEALPKELHG